MATSQQINANLANAQRSTGPRSAEGKQKSSQNALRHGLAATSVDRFPTIIRAEYRELHTKLKQELAPGSFSEDIAFESYVFAQFMLFRAQTLEAIALDQHISKPNDPKILRQLEQASRYSKGHAASARRALKQLETLQANRLIAAELQELIGAPETSGIEVPIAFPSHVLLNPKQLKSSKPDLALRFLSFGQQNEPKSTSLE